MVFPAVMYRCELDHKEGWRKDRGSLSHIRLFVTPQTIACQAPWFMEFSRQEYWSGLPFHSAGDLLNPVTELGLPHCRQIFFFFLPSEPPGKPKEGWEQNWCFLIVVLEKTLESLLDCKDIKPVNPKGNQPWIVTGRTDVEAEAPILWPLDEKSWLIGKDPDAGRDGGLK